MIFPSKMLIFALNTCIDTFGNSKCIHIYIYINILNEILYMHMYIYCIEIICMKL